MESNYERELISLLVKDFKDTRVGRKDDQLLESRGKFHVNDFIIETY